MAPSPAGLRFDFEWRITLFTVLLVPIMAGLGYWQLQRAEEKAALAASWDQRQLQPPATVAELSGWSAADLAYYPVRLSGTLLQDAYFLLDNRIQGGRFGYEVLAVMQLDGDEGAVLVNRGWIAGDAARLVLPDVPALTGRVELTGTVYVPPGKPYLLAEQRLQPGWPKRLQAVEMELLAPALATLANRVALPYTVRIDPDQPGALSVDWQIVNVSPAKHRGYALQWFTMAGVLSIIYLLRCSNIWEWLKGRS